MWFIKCKNVMGNSSRLEAYTVNFIYYGVTGCQPRELFGRGHLTSFDWHPMKPQ